MHSPHHSTPAWRRRSVKAMLGAATAFSLIVAALSPITAQAAPAENWPLVVTQIVANNAGTDNYEFAQVTNTTDADISLTDGTFSLAYTSNTSVPASTRTDYALTVSGTSTTVPAGGTLVLWNKSSSAQLALTDADFRAFWAAQNPKAPTDYLLGVITGTNGFSNSASRGIRVLDEDGANVSYGFYDSGAYGDNMATNFSTPANANSPQLEIYSTGVLASPGSVDPLQLSNKLSGENFIPLSNADDANLDGLVNVPRVTAMLERMHFMGNFLLVKDGEPTLISNGFSDASTETLNDADTLFATASLEKAMTATLIELLISEGRLSFDSTLSEFLPHFGLSAPWADSVTVDMLLKHTSGIRMPEMPVLSDPSDQASAQVVLATEQEQIEHALNSITIQSPGSFSYSNGNYTMLAAIASAVTDQPFETLMEERVFEPAGMDSTYFWDTIPADQQGRVAHEYAYQDGADYGTAGGPVATESLQSTLLGAGNVFTTIGDLYKFYQATSDGSVLTADQYQELSTTDLQNGYAGGLYHYPGKIKRARGSASTDEAGGRYNSFVYGDEDNQNLVLILSNQSLISGNPAPMNSYDNFAENVYLELSQEPAISSVAETTRSTGLGVQPELPAKVLVTFTSGVSQAVTVKWEKLTVDQLAKAGTLTVSGKLRGLNARAVATITVKGAPAPSASPTPTPKPSPTPTPKPTASPTPTAKPTPKARATSVRVKLNKPRQRYSSGTPAKLKITVTPKVSGTAYIYDRGKKIAKVKIVKGKSKTYRFSKKLKRGTHKIRVVFKPSSSGKYRTSTSKTVTLKVLAKR